MIKKMNILSLLFVFGLSLAAFSSFSVNVQAGCWVDGGSGSPYYDADDSSCTEMEAFVVEEAKIDDEPFNACEIWPGLCIPGFELVIPSDDTSVSGTINTNPPLVLTGSGGGDDEWVPTTDEVPTTLDICIVPGACPAPVIEIPVVPVLPDLPTAQFDACPNIDGTQSSVPAGMVKDDSFNCVYPLVSDPGISIQTCQNRAATNFGDPLPCSYLGDAITTVVPQTGQTCQDRNATNFGGSLPCNYSGPAITVVDACSNIDGVQSGIPTGMTANSSGNCVPIVVVPPPPIVVVSSTDVCPNLSGLQTSVPAGRTKNTSTGNCDLIVTSLPTGPVANISVSPSSVAEGGSVSFTASGVKGSSIIVWHRLYVSTNQNAGWSGAGPESSSVSGSLGTIPRNPKIFNGPGSYSVIYEVKDLDGRIGSASRSVGVTPAACVGAGCGPVLPPGTPPGLGIPPGGAEEEEEEEETFGGFTLDGDTVASIRFLANLGGETETKTLVINPFGDFAEPIVIQTQSNGCPSSAQYSFGGGAFVNQPQAQVTMIYDGANYRNEISRTIGLPVKVKFSQGFSSVCNITFEANGGGLTDSHTFQINPSVANPIFREI